MNQGYDPFSPHVAVFPAAPVFVEPLPPPRAAEPAAATPAPKAPAKATRKPAAKKAARKPVKRPTTTRRPSAPAIPVAPADEELDHSLAALDAVREAL